MDKWFNKLRNRSKKTGSGNKENVDVFDPHAHHNNSRHVNFRESSAPARSTGGGGGRKNYCYSDDENEEYDGDDGASEVTLKARSQHQHPLNPYSVITEPKRNKGPRSCPGGVDDDHRSGRNTKSGRQQDDHDRSFHSEFLSARQQPQRRYLNLEYKYQQRGNDGGGGVEPLREASNRGGWKRSFNRAAYSSNNKNADDAAAAEEATIASEMDREWANDRMKKYEEKCRRLTECLQIAINNERQAKNRKKQYHQLYEDATRKNMKLQTELERMRTIIYGLETELHRNRMLLAQREDHHLLMDPLYHHQHQHSQQQQNYHRLLNAPPSHLGSLFSNTATTPSSTINGGGSMPRQFPHEQVVMMPGVGREVQCTGSGGGGGGGGGGSGESLALLSSSSLGMGGGAVQHQHQLPGPMSILCGSGVADQQQGSSSLVKHRIPLPTTLAFSPSHFGQFNSLLSGGGSSTSQHQQQQDSDETKNFRSQHIDSFSGSSRPGTGDLVEMQKIKGELAEYSLSSRATTRIHSDTSSPEIARSNPMGMHISASCLGISLLHQHKGTDHSFASQITLIKDDGYSTSETTSTLKRPPPVTAENNNDQASDGLLQLKRSASLN